MIGEYRHLHYDMRTGQPLKPRRERQRQRLRALPGEMESLCCGARALETPEGFTCAKCKRACSAHHAGEV